MSFRLQVIILCCMFAVFLYIVNLMRKKAMDYKFALGWLVVVAIISVLAVFPALLARCSTLLGIASPVNMLFFLGFCLVVLLIFSLSITISKLTDKVKKLSQEIAIIRKDMYDRCNELEKQADKES